MATLDTLATALKQKIPVKASTKALSDAEYQDGFDLFLYHDGWDNYRNFVIPKLSQLLDEQFRSRQAVSVLEIGPGPKSVLGYLPSFVVKKVASYTAYEPNQRFARRLKDWLHPTEDASPFPSMNISSIHGEAFTQDTITNDKYHIILFCHSLYGMSKDQVVRHSLHMLSEEPDEGIVVVCHRDGTVLLDNLVCQQSALFPEGTLRIKDSDSAIDTFTPFMAGCSIQDAKIHNDLHIEWRKLCRKLAQREDVRPSTLTFASPEVIMVFTQHATQLAELASLVPLVPEDYKVKNREAQSHAPAAVIRPTEVGHVQRCINWALKYRLALTVVGGGHSGHCRWPNIVSIDMGSFNKIHIVQDAGELSDTRALVVVGAGCKTGDIILATTAKGLTVPLGARPSVGTGLWLQGGIGHLSRSHGLACDAIVGAVLVSVESGQVLCVGHIPDEHQPIDAVRPSNEEDLLWSLKGAGTNFAIVITVVFKAYTARSFSVKEWLVPLRDGEHGTAMLQKFSGLLARRLCPESSVDAYLHYADEQLVLGVTLFQSNNTELGKDSLPMTPQSFIQILGEHSHEQLVDAVGLFDTEMYISRMHGGHSGGKTSAFKRCVFIKDIDRAEIANTLLRALERRPSPLCYFHFLHGGGSVEDVSSHAAAFGCRSWDFACVVTGVWPRGEDDTPAARATIRWVYDVVEVLIPVSQGVYGTDLGPDPRDAVLATKAFGPNLRKLVRLKQVFDPYNVLAYACPISPEMLLQKVVVLVTGEHGAGKDHCANIWSSTIYKHGHSSSILSISDATKREYAAQTGADLQRLLMDRVYKEQHRGALTRFFEQQLKGRPRLAAENFVQIVRSADVDVLFITGMRDEAPMAMLWHLVPDVRLVDVRVEASRIVRSLRRQSVTDGDLLNHDNVKGTEIRGSDTNYRPSFIFDNNAASDDEVKAFAKGRLLPFMSDDLRRLARMVRSVPNFPKTGIDFRHCLGICQQTEGLSLYTSLVVKHLGNDWRKFDAIVTCDAGGLMFAGSLAQEIKVGLVTIRPAGKLPPPTISVKRCSSHVSSPANGTANDRIEMDANALRKGARVVVVDDVLATGNTLLAILELLIKAGVDVEDIVAMVVAEFPLHQGRERLRRGGFGRANIQSLLIFNGK
ncbi:phosphoribosyl transferase domain [Fusarium longipes]|uniref:Phosphoribosyl transferase domain n=1 Tax=Fusarium longipes TaxID=694270 RepID=A0A395S4L9_9HYPO|nr:phosphoribosyl transferase domain [Fusarium longipes]